MRRTADEWRAAYARLLRQRLDGVWFYPITCDTPDLVQDLSKSALSFSGAVGLGFANGDDIHLTWRQVEYDFELYSSDREGVDWTRGGVDRIQMSGADPWGALLGAELIRVDLYLCETGEGQETTTAAHHFRAGDREAVLWVSTSYREVAGAGDDLLVTLDRDPTDPATFTLGVSIQ